jgi:hypothetical protein
MKALCLLMQKNEVDLLPLWLGYHASLFGAENLVVIDNGSFEPEVLSELVRAERRGTRVLREFSGNDSFENKGEIVGSLIAEYESTGRFDVFFPLDCDEFIGVHVDGEAYFDQSAIFHELEQRRSETGPLKIAGSYYNFPGPGNRFLFFDEAKVFFNAGTFSFIDGGFHSGVSKLQTPELRTNIVHVHYQHKPLELLKAHAREKLKAHVDVDDDAQLKAFNGSGSHLVKYFFIDPDHYEKMFDASAAVLLPRFVEQLQQAGFQPPFQGR